jgi:tRNA/tmRNA/rRNA uracil-C5-methylase (TrmA/RlmC/RlmD family)
MSKTSAADTRKIKRLEEDLEEADKQKKTLERKIQNLTRDFQEVTEKYEALGTFKTQIILHKNIFNSFPLNPMFSNLFQLKTPLQRNGLRKRLQRF